MLAEEYRDFFVGASGATGALIGLLFVAISLAPQDDRPPAARTAFRTRSSAALLVFTNALVLSLAALVPGDDLGWWCVACSAGVLAFSLATLRSAIAERRRTPRELRSFGLVAALLVIVAFELRTGIRLVRDAADPGAGRTLCYLVIADLAVGIARAWQLASMRDTGLLASLRTLARGEPTDPETPPTERPSA
ncbi:hypothetical protein [Streptomyces subrutilus]|uniref:Uncharacterized protein n=1 Tax=Streptomyces subrutilus TaxID=36818 RepID=A0A5P2UVF4_9ACTN|nr:hypothetical protein [Streptomyces subrutilus]QEU82205.1 hypothetical protein CP968_31550 [Streptomyces subrutilus]WSJ28313.1 hypothetical protein OG479_02825 [Streptomyces subrutilus]GGZ92172.1 hypothetical protein GCM10010371_59910 [Streptomyces subrutilus]